MYDDDPVAIYLREVSTVPALTREEEIELLQHALADDQRAESARKRLIETNLGLVVSIAQNYKDSGEHVLDLIVAGNDGLLLAVNTSSGESQESFSTRVMACVNEAIKKKLSSQARAFRKR